ncbi:MAG: hypothetical protein JO159_11940 [Acidobacteria bacterium]|nr:hypothetical protein [Acidobacteriota bacterium]
MNPYTSSGTIPGTASERPYVDGLGSEHSNLFSDYSVAPRRSGYGLPCANCKTYYAADLGACPICKSPQRVSPLEMQGPMGVFAQPEILPDLDQLEQERERFLEEFNSQLTSVSFFADSASATPTCERTESHPNFPRPASVCQDCYGRLAERVDVLEAAMHIDVKEAAQIVYDAVWADPSDPGKTYENAAQALLGELRRRSGVPEVLGPLQPPLN